MSDFEWCTDCKEYDMEKHCCPRFNKVIRTTLNYNINAVLYKIRVEIEELDGRYIYGGNSPKYVPLWEVLHIIDKYKEGEDKK